MISNAWKGSLLTAAEELSCGLVQPDDRRTTHQGQLFYFSLVENCLLALEAHEPAPRGDRLTGIAKL
jgi:hypothetical protein